MTRSRSIRRSLVGLAWLGLLVLGTTWASVQPAQACWAWRDGVRVWAPCAPVVGGYVGHPWGHRIWVPGHYAGGGWVPGHWGWS
jgi:hypothetical protein